MGRTMWIGFFVEFFVDLRADERSKIFLFKLGQTFIWTLQLLDQIGPVGRFVEKKGSF